MNQQPLITLPRLHGNGRASDEWYTPSDIIERARLVLGDIDLDPASCAAADVIVRAGRYFSLEDDGLIQTWRGRVWLNPPYSDPRPWVDKLIDEHEAGNVTAAILLVNSSTETAGFQRLLARYLVCLPADRLEFWGPNQNGRGNNRYAQAIFYAGVNVDSFHANFETLGVVVGRWLAGRVEVQS